MNKARLKIFNPEVLFADEPVVKLGRADIDLLLKKVWKNQRKRIRLCTHKGISDKLHEMFIVHTKDTYVRPHKHLNKSESFFILQGKADVVLFDQKGKIKQVIEMGDYSSGRKFYYRLAQPFFHSLLIYSKYLIFHEVTNGPFKKSDTIFAPWSPDINEVLSGKEFTAKLKKQLKKSKIRGKK
ncbi:MAG: WbuC family cupin fold metalloprotein [Candidatus Omnitrophica bacterium]|nr:WbuC family cupin fold metalloprotein [Candidatus Omnitrophota bacterium]